MSSNVRGNVTVPRLQDLNGTCRNLIFRELPKRYPLMADFDNLADTIFSQMQYLALVEGYDADALFAWLKTTDEWKAGHGSPPPNGGGGGGGGSHADPLVGGLIARNGIFYDDTGPRLPQFYHCMPAIRVYNDDVTRFREMLDAGVRAGRHGVRFGAPLVEDEHQNNDYWVGCHVSPEMAMDLIPTVLNELQSHQLRAHIFGSHNFGGDWNRERQWIHDFCARIAQAGRAETVGLFEWRNEFNMTSPYGGYSQTTYDHGAEAMKIAKDALGCVTTMGSPGEDDGYIAGTIVNGTYHTNDGAVAPSLPPGYRGDAASIDFGRGLPCEGMVKHVDRAYYDGRYKGKYQGASLWVTEPTGPNEAPAGHVGDVYLPMDDRECLFGYHMRMALDGMAVSYFNGPGVRYKYPIDTGWGFHEIPAFVRDWIPQNIGEWRGPTFMVKDNSWVTVLCEEWRYIGDPSHPMTSIDGRPIKSWRALFADGRTLEGQGGVGFDPGWKTVTIRGDFT